MPEITFFDQIKNRLLNTKWIAYLLLFVIIAGGGVKLWKDLSSVLPQPIIEPPSTEPNIQVQEQIRPIYFTPGSHKLTTSNQKKIQQYASLLKEYKYKGIMLRSHTHAISPIPNFNISEARAIAIRDTLVDSGIQAESILIVPFGGEQAGSAANAEYANRVEIFIVWE